MEPLFEAESVLDKELYTRFQTATFHENKTYLLSYVMAGILFVIALVVAMSKEFVTFSLCAVLGVALLFLPKITVASAVKQLEEKSCVVYGHPFTVRFFEDELMEFTPYAQTQVPYTMVHHVLETDLDLFIFISPMQAVCVPKSAVERGSSQALVKFLREYRGVPYKSV